IPVISDDRALLATLPSVISEPGVSVNDNQFSAAVENSSDRRTSSVVAAEKAVWDAYAVALEKTSLEAYQLEPDCTRRRTVVEVELLPMLQVISLPVASMAEKVSINP